MNDKKEQQINEWRKRTCMKCFTQYDITQIHYCKGPILEEGNSGDLFNFMKGFKK